MPVIETNVRSNPAEKQVSEPDEKKPAKSTVYMMDLWSFIPYYMGQLSSALMKEGVEVQLGSSRYHLDRAYFQRIGLKPDPFLLDKGGQVKSARVRRFLKAAEYVFNLLGLALRFAFSRPDITHVQYMPFLERGFTFEIWYMRWLHFLGIPVVYTVHNVTPQDSPGSHRENYKRVYRLADALICHGLEARAQLVQEFRVPGDKIRVIPHGPLFAEKPALSTAEARKVLGLKAEVPVILCLGVISEYKGIPFLLQVWKQVLESGVRATLLIAGTGDGKLLASIHEYVIENGMQDTVDLRLRFIAVEEIPIFHQVADILVYPYSGGTTSGALLTGMNYQKAILATTLPFFRELLRDGENALLVPYADLPGWTRAIKSLLGDSNQRERLGNAIRTVDVQGWDWQSIARETIKCYESVAKRTDKP